MKPNRSLHPLHFAIVLFASAVLAMCSGDDPVTAPGATLTVSGDHSVLVGESLTLSVATSEGTDTGYRWVSSSNAVATVTDAGAVTGVSAGEAVLTVTGVESGATAEHVMVVIAQPTVATASVAITGNPFVQVGSFVVLSAATANGTDDAYTWASSDELVATVSASGMVEGHADGTATISATGNDSGATGTLTVNVAHEIPNYDKWLASGHADAQAEAFIHWNEDDPAEVPEDCARCHSAPGFEDFIGADGSEAGLVDQPAAIGSVLHCGVCHNETSQALSSVEFPSGAVVDQLGSEALCMTCHQGRASTDSVDTSIDEAGVGDDEVSTELGFQNIHYYPAGATINAGRVRGGYQYEGEVYDWRFRHVPGVDTCTGCHDPHSLEVRVDLCKTCHEGVEDLEDLHDIRMIASRNQDYDGDGDRTEGIFYEVQGLREKLLSALNAYTVSEELGALCYDEATYPYWFKGGTGGICGAADATFANRFQSWTPRLMRAAYNFQLSLKDPGAFAHNGKYIIQLLFDSVTDLNGTLAEPIDMAAAVRNDFGHFNGSSQAARNWDENELVSASCSKCHGGAEGFRFFIQHGVSKAIDEPDNGLDCATCHESFGDTYDLVTVNSVTYPGGLTITEPGHTSNICGTCHSGRESKATIDAQIAANKFGFRNVHYLPASGVKRGTLAKVGYEYTGKTYSGEWTTHGRCDNCHDAKATNHSFSPRDNPSCGESGCHEATDVEDIRNRHATSYDGGDPSRPLNEELATFAARLLTAIQNGRQICYDAHRYPYFIRDTNSNGVCDEDESSSYTPWNAQLMKAAHNYQIFQKEPGAWAHNFDYMGQLLYDSIEDLGGNLTGLVRPSIQY